MTALERTSVLSPLASRGRDLLAGLVVFLVALPLCLGIALASNAPMFSGIVAGITGGIVVGTLSGSHTSVSGPAAGLAAIVASQIDALGSFETFLAVVVLAGGLQIALGLLRAGVIASFVPATVVKGLLAAIGVLLICKQLPYVIGLDPVWTRDLSLAQIYEQFDAPRGSRGLWPGLNDVHWGAAAIGLVSVALLVVWDRLGRLRSSNVPGPLAVALVGLGLGTWFEGMSTHWQLGMSQRVVVPLATTGPSLVAALRFPDWSQLATPAVIEAGCTLALVASLETLFNLHATDALDPQQRRSPPNRELFAQGVGNLVSGLIGGLPITSVIARSTVNIHAGARTRLSTIFHGALILAAILFIPGLLNRIPLASLAAILVVTGCKLASPRLLGQMYKGGQQKLLPFIATATTIVLIDLLTGILIGLGVSAAFTLRARCRRPLRQCFHRHAGQDVLHIELAKQVSLFVQPRLHDALLGVARGGHVLIDARRTDFIDPDVLELIHNFRTTIGPARGIDVTLLGFEPHLAHRFETRTFVNHKHHNLQATRTPDHVLTLLKEGNERYQAGRPNTRACWHPANAGACGRPVLAVLLCCMDSHAPVESLFGMHPGDLLSVRVTGTVAQDDVLGSLEFACTNAGARLIIVMGHTGCDAIRAAIERRARQQFAHETSNCTQLDVLVDELHNAIEPDASIPLFDSTAYATFCAHVARRNVERTIRGIHAQSSVLRRLVDEGTIRLVGGVHDPSTGEVKFFETTSPVRP